LKQFEIFVTQSPFQENENFHSVGFGSFYVGRFRNIIRYKKIKTKILFNWKDHEKVTCGSAIKLTHRESDYKLHSHAVQYGSGSGQQSITAFPKPDDPNSLFTVRFGVGIDCARGYFAF
jgi:hypothetical protein